MEAAHFDRLAKEKWFDVSFLLEVEIQIPFLRPAAAAQNLWTQRMSRHAQALLFLVSARVVLQ
jgi:hypothetical protein